MKWERYLYWMRMEWPHCMESTPILPQRIAIHIQFSFINKSSSVSLSIGIGKVFISYEWCTSICIYSTKMHLSYIKLIIKHSEFRTFAISLCSFAFSLGSVYLLCSYCAPVWFFIHTTPLQVARVCVCVCVACKRCYECMRSERCVSIGLNSYVSTMEYECVPMVDNTPEMALKLPQFYIVFKI